MGDVATMQGSEHAIVRVLVPLALPTLLDYVVKEAVQAGSWVEVPVGKKDVAGVVVEVLAESPFKALKVGRVREDVVPLDSRTLGFYRWVARYTLSAPGEPLRVALPRAVIPALPKKKRVKKGAAQEIPDVVKVTLNDAQRDASGAIGDAGGFKVFLLDGVTGSGKTEVYFEVLEHLMADGAQVLVTVPEIALTPQWLERFKRRFGVEPQVWHSGLSEGDKRRTWWRVVSGEPCVVVGARSALFLPFANLKLVVVDEEHDPSYKQDEAFRYHGRDMAVQLARSWDCPIVLASATPSLESWQRGIEGRYTVLKLPVRHGTAVMPEITLVDMRAEKVPVGSFVSGALRDAVAETLARGEQSLLFLNRRGTAPVLICRECGERRDCPNCDATLVVHGEHMQCHHCGYTEARPDECPACNSTELKPYGPGTRRVVAEVQAMFPEARIAVADSDAVSTPKQLEALVHAMETHAVDIVVGTQMVTKGHHFPLLTLVGVVDADMGLAHGDLRASERTFQLLTQVAGRAGRAERKGRVLVQTYDPAQPLFGALVKADRDGFYALELEARQAWGDPPFGRQVAVIIDGMDEREVQRAAQALARSFGTDKPMRLLGPAPAPVARVRNRYRWRLLLKGPRVEHALVKEWLETVALPRGVRVTVDVDPVSFM